MSVLLNPYRYAAAGGGGGTVTTFFPLDTANGYANLGTLSATGNAAATGSGAINTTRVKNRAQAYTAPDTGSKLTMPVGAFPNCGTSDWCLELWAAIDMSSARKCALCGDTGSSTNPGFILMDHDVLTSHGVRYFVNASDGTAYTLLTNEFKTSYTWYHWCIIRSSNTLYFMFDGVQKGTASVTGKSFNFSTNTTWSLNRHFDSGEPTIGTVSEIRFTLGSAVYNPAGFTPPTGPLTP